MRISHFNIWGARRNDVGPEAAIRERRKRVIPILMTAIVTALRLCRWQ